MERMSAAQCALLLFLKIQSIKFDIDVYPIPIQWRALVYSTALCKTESQSHKHSLPLQYIPHISIEMKIYYVLSSISEC